MAISTTHLTIDTTNKKFTGELSTLEFFYGEEMYTPEEKSQTGVGIRVLNPNTNKSVLFNVDKFVKDVEGDLCYILCCPSQAELDYNPKLKGWEMVIYND